MTEPQDDGGHSVLSRAELVATAGVPEAEIERLVDAGVLAHERRRPARFRRSTS